MSTSETLELPRVARDQLGPLNEALGKHRQLHFQLWDTPYRMEVFSQLDPFKADFTLALELFEETLALSVRHFPPLEHFSPKLQGLSLGALPEDLYPVILDYVLGTLLDEIEKNYHHSAVLSSVVLGPPTQSYPHKLYARIFNDNLNVPIDVCFQAEKSLFQKLVKLMSEMPLTPVDNFGPITFGFSIEYGRFELPLPQIKDLALGDILLLGPDCYPCCETLTLLLPQGLRMKARVADTKATVTDIMSETDTIQESPSIKPKAKASAVASGLSSVAGVLEQLPVTVSFDVGEKTLSLEELKSLKPGYTFSFEHGKEQPIFIRANGRLLGHGELVQIEEHVGVRIVAFLDHANA